MRFADPRWLNVLVVWLAFWLAAAYWVRARRRRALLRFAGGSAPAAVGLARVNPHRRVLRLLLLVFMVVSALVALARPQWGVGVERVTRRGIDVAIAVDTSLSMATEDLSPSRLGHARSVAARLLGRLGGDRVALVTFAGAATVDCPLTTDTGAVRLFLDALDPEYSAVPGTGLGAGLTRALEALRSGEKTGSESRSRVVILFTDGEDHEGGIESASGALQQSGIPVHVVGCGTPAGAPIPLRSERGQINGYKKDREGRVVTSRLAESALEALGRESGGSYRRATPAELEVDDLAQILSGLDTGDSGSVLRTRYAERFQIPLLVAFLALVFECGIRDRRRETERIARTKEAA